MRNADPVNKVAKTLTDPWMGACCLPDTSQGACFTLKYVIPILTDVNGWANAVVTTEYNNAYFAFVGLGTNNYNFPAASSYTPTANSAAIASIFSKIRPVSLGYKWFPTTSATADSGTVECAQIPGTVNPNGGISGTPSVQALATAWEEGPARQVCKMTWRPDDYSTMGKYIQASSNSLLTAPPSFAPQLVPFLFFGIQGAAASTTVGRLEVVLNLEGQVRAQGLFIGEAVTEKPPAISDWTTKVANAVRKTLQFGMPIAKTVLSLL